MSWAKFNRLSSSKDLSIFRRGTTASDGGGGGGNDPDAQAYIDALDSAGYTVSGAEETAINTFVVDLKADGIWAKSKAIYPFIGGTAATHKFNLKDPRDLDAAFRLTFFGGWTHSATGALPNGTNGYAQTHLIPDTELSISSAHFSKYNRNNDLIGNKIDGIYQDQVQPSAFFQNNYSAKSAGIGDLAAQFVYLSVSTDAFFVVTRTSDSLIKTFRNSAQAGTSAATVTRIPSVPVFIGARSYNGNPGFYNSYEAAFASIGDGLTDIEVSDYYTAVQALQTALNREV